MTHINLVNNAMMVAHRTGILPGTRAAMSVQMYHSLGNTIGTLTAAARGSVAVYPANKWDTNARVTAVEKWKCTDMFGPPSAFIELLKRVEDGGEVVKNK